MVNVLFLSIWLLVWLAIQVALYYYLWRRLIRETRLGAPWTRRLTAALVALAISVPLMLLATRFISVGFARTVGWPLFVWMGAALLMVTVLGMLDLARIAAWGTRVLAGQSRVTTDPARRAFISRVIGGSAVATAGGVAGAGIYQALRTPDVVEIPIELARFPQNLDGFAIVQISDVHIGHTIGRGFVRDMVDRVNAAGGDLVAITGDLVDGKLAELADAAAPLADLRAPHGVYFVTGNHEYYSGADEWLEYLRTLGIRVLRNERVSIGRGDDCFDLAGIDDHSAYRYPGHGPDLARAVAGRDPGRELVLLAHQPRQVRDAVEHDVGLQLSGHTHGGQIWPWHYLVMAQQGGLLAGHFHHGDTQLYVSRGTGYWGPPVRVLAPAEITRVVLRRRRHTV